MKTATKSNGRPAVAAGTERRPVTVADFLSARGRGVHLTLLTAYDNTMARPLNAAGTLVGGSLGMVAQGSADNLSFTLDEMIYHTRIVAQEAKSSLVVADLPFVSFQASPQQALQNAGRIIKDTAAPAVKLEGGGAQRTWHLVRR